MCDVQKCLWTYPLGKVKVSIVFVDLNVRYRSKIMLQCTHVSVENISNWIRLGMFMYGLKFCDLNYWYIDN